MPPKSAPSKKTDAKKTQKVVEVSVFPSKSGCQMLSPYFIFFGPIKG